MKLTNIIIPALVFGLAVTFTPMLNEAKNPSDIWTREPAVVMAERRAAIHYSFRKDLFSFMSAISRFESGGNIKSVNRYGMLGKYQFHINTLRVIGMPVKRSVFLKNEDIQDRAMILYMKQNREELLPYIQKYSGRKIFGVNITESSILAGAHFAGSTGVINFFKYGRNRRDGNGTRLTYYMSRFSGFNLEQLVDL